MSQLKELLALRRENPERLRELLMERHLTRCVNRGIWWLNQNAPVGWMRNLFDPTVDGRSVFRAHDSYENECVLALAFESRADLADQFGYVTYASVANKLGIRRTEHYGFSAPWGMRLKEPSKARDYGKLLDQLWERRVREYLASRDHLPYRHETEIDRRWKAIDSMDSFSVSSSEVSPRMISRARRAAAAGTEIITRAFGRH